MARLIFHRKRGYVGMTREVVIRIDGDARLRLASGDRAAIGLSGGAHLIEALVGKDQPSAVDLVIGEHDEIYFVCKMANFFRPTPVLQVATKTTVKQRFPLDRKSATESAPVQQHNAVWSGVLGVRPDATFDEIHRAYIRQMRMYHPDLISNQGEGVRETAAWKAREINMAYTEARKQAQRR